MVSRRSPASQCMQNYISLHPLLHLHEHHCCMQTMFCVHCLKVVPWTWGPPGCLTEHVSPLIATLAGDPFVVNQLKPYFQRLRPSDIHNTYAFPSGHTTAAVFIMGKYRHCSSVCTSCDYANSVHMSKLSVIVQVQLGHSYSSKCGSPSEVERSVHAERMSTGSVTFTNAGSCCLHVLGCKLQHIHRLLSPFTSHQ